MLEKHSRPTGAGRAVWYTARLWQMARGLPVHNVAIASIPEFDQDCWFGTSYVPSCRAVAVHARRILDADLGYPIILSADGSLMDGGHRLAKAWLLGQTEIKAVRFTVDPEPDYIVAEPSMNSNDAGDAGDTGDTGDTGDAGKARNRSGGTTIHEP